MVASHACMGDQSAVSPAPGAGPGSKDRRSAVGVIAVYSIKGGVGKTTLAYDLAWRSAILGGHRTLLWDLDLQGGAAFLLDEEQPRTPFAAAAFRPGGMLRRQIRNTRHANLFLLPADVSLRFLPAELAQMGQNHRLTAITQLLSGEFTRIVLDCPPALNEISDQVIAAADLMLTPLPPSPLSMRAKDLIIAELAASPRRTPPLFPVLSMVDTRRRFHREAIAGMAVDWPVVPFSSDIEQIAVRRAPIETFAPRSRGARALDALYRQVEARLTELARRSAAPVPAEAAAKAPSACRPAAAPAPLVPRAMLPAVIRPPAWKRALRWLLRV